VALAWFEEQTSWEDIFSGPALPIQVRVVKMANISGTILELEFVKFLLLYSPVLEKMFVRPAEYVTPELKKALIGFERASGEAEVIWDDSS
ncbi:F-box/RNI/FBD-like domain protein, partial [Trifolium medium]|nr:F-box/RNI/FBD-like domain protein [Trifolium medium]